MQTPSNVNLSSRPLEEKHTSSIHRTQSSSYPPIQHFLDPTQRRSGVRSRLDQARQGVVDLALLLLLLQLDGTLLATDGPLAAGSPAAGEGDGGQVAEAVAAGREAGGAA